MMLLIFFSRRERSKRWLVILHSWSIQANIFICSLEQKYLNGCPTEIKPVLYRRYVDDTFCLFKHRDHIDKFLEYINNFHSNIKFTVDVQEDNKLPFLDVLVTCL